MKFKSFIYSLCIAAFIFACEANDIDTIKAPDNLFKTTSLDMQSNENANAESGAYIIRFDDEFRVFLIDGKRGISASFGADNLAFCNGDPNPFDIVSHQIIFLPTDEERLIFLQQGEVYTEVFDGVPTGGNFCDFLLNTPILANGMFKFVTTDNDLNVSDNNNTNSWGARGHGRLLNQEGDTVNFTGIMHFVDDKNSRFKADIALRLQR